MLTDLRLLSALVGLSARTLRSLAEELRWNHTNLSLGLNEVRPFPKARVAPLLTALGLTLDARPDPAKPWLARCDEIDGRDALLRVLAHFFPDGGVARQIRPDKGLLALAESVYGLRDGDGLTRVCLRLRRNPIGREDPDEPAPHPFSKADLTRLGFECLPEVRVPRDRYGRWRTGELANREFDEDVLAKKVREPTWKDVVAAAKRRGIRPGDAMAALMDLKADAG